LLDAYFKRLRDGEVRLVLLRERAAPAQIFRIANGDWSVLRRALETVTYDGATSFGAFASEPGVGEYLLFSDGLATFGDAPFPNPGSPVYAISAALKSDPVRLRHIAHASGGRFIDLTAQAPGQAAAVLLGETTRVIDVGGEGVADLVLASPYPERGRSRWPACSPSRPAPCGSRSAATARRARRDRSPSPATAPTARSRRRSGRGCASRRWKANTN
jgi:hypothetical protein